MVYQLALQVGENVISKWTANMSYLISNLSISDVNVEIKLIDNFGNRVTDFNSAGFSSLSGQFTQSPLADPAVLGASKTGGGVVTDFPFAERLDDVSPVKVSWTSSDCLTDLYWLIYWEMSPGSKLIM